MALVWPQPGVIEGDSDIRQQRRSIKEVSFEFVFGHNTFSTLFSAKHLHLWYTL
jgi:hypothetical protein